MGKLTALRVAKLSKRGRYGDGGNLWLQVSEWGTKAWLFRYTLNGRPRTMGLGSCDTFSLAEARERARAARQQVADGIDPLEAKRATRMATLAENASRISFEEAAERYIAAHRAGWRNAMHAGQWSSTLAAYVLPVIGELPVATIDTAHVLKIIEPMWAAKPETASRVRGRIELVLNWAAARGMRQGDNPARWRGHLDHLLPAKAKVRKVAHLDAMPYGQVPAFVARLRDMQGIVARALEFTILAAARTGEVNGAKWSEIDFAAKVWTIPGGRMKAGREHRVPLSDRALEILAGLPRAKDNPHVFIGSRAGEGIARAAMLKFIRGNSAAGSSTIHGFRSSFRDWCGEATAFPREVAEAALAHSTGDATEQAYRRGDALEKRRRLMQAWAAYCERPTSSGQVTPMRRRAQ